ncbi:MAG: hypothetical protein JOZ62_12865 [Acidobacteriaceae bacterium]|nr:hypothetical protein [Acidobacteriaceae bacterium]
MATKPNLHAVVVVCPLTRDAIDSAVEHAAEELQGLRDALQHAPQLYEVLSSPLMLDVARIAYSSRDWTVPAEATVDELQQRLFDKYTDHMLNPETPDTSSTKRVRNALRWIASNMKVRGYLYFDRDNVTSLSWLPRKLQYRAVTSSSFLVGMRVCFFFATICGAAGFALGSIGGSWLGYGLGITAALVSVSVGVFLTIVAIFIWPTYEDRISDYFDLIYQSKAHESKQALALRARTESVERSVRDWVLRRRWAGCFLRLLYFAGRGTTWLLAWAKRAFIITLVLCCILLFPIGAVIGFVVGPLISYLLVGTAAKRAMKELGNREAETVSYTRRNPNLRILIAGIVCRVLVFGKVMEYVVRWILWTEELAPFDPDQLLRIAEQRAILRRTGRNFFSFIHPLLMDHFARTEKLSHHTGTFIDAR